MSTSESLLNHILSAYEDVIRGQQVAGSEHEPTATEYFVVILRTMATGGKINEHLPANLHILKGIIPQTSKMILKDQFKLLSSLLLKIAQDASDNAKLLRLSIEVLGLAMKYQDTTEGFWGSMMALQTLNAFLSLLDDSRFKVRKAVSDQLVALLQVHKMAKSTAVSSYVRDFSLGVLGSCTRSDYKRSLYVVYFLESALALIPNDSITTMVRAILNLQGCSQPVLTAASLRAIDAYFQSPYVSLNGRQAVECLEILLSSTPTTADMEANGFYCTAVASGLVLIKKLNPQAMSVMLLPGVQHIVNACDAEFIQIHIAAAGALKRIITWCVDDAMIAQAAQIGDDQKQRSVSPSLLTQMVAVMETLLQLRYQHAWTYVLDSVRCLFEKIKGDQADAILGKLVVKLADVCQAIESGSLSLDAIVALAIRDSLGTMLRSLGLVNFLRRVPLTSSSDNNLPSGVIAPAREWILSVLHTNLKLMPCKLQDFDIAILNIARNCNQIVKHPERFGLNASQMGYVRKCILQLWSVFPDVCFCGPADIAFAFPKMVQTLEGAMKDETYPELMPHIVTGLTHLARAAARRVGGVDDDSDEGTILLPAGATSPDLEVLRAHAKLFLPTVLTFLETVDLGDSRHPPLIQCMSTWTAIAPPKLVSALAKKLLELLLTSTHVSAMQTQPGVEQAAGWMAVMQAIIPHLPTEMIQILYRTIRPLLSVAENISMQKRAYHVLEGLLRSHGDTVHTVEPRQAIFALINDSLLNCHVSARNMRLRCLETLMSSMTEEEIRGTADSILGEVLICQKDANKKSRDSAVTLLRTMIRRISSSEMLVKLCSGVVGETATMRASAVVGICVLLLERRDDEELLNNAIEILPTVCLLLQQECVEQTRAVLSFVRVCVSVLPRDYIVNPDILSPLVLAFTTSLGAHKTKFASRVRAIMRKLVQRVGEEAVRPHVPDADSSLLEYILKQQRRTYRKQLRKEQAMQNDLVDKMLGSDSESDDDDGVNETNGSMNVDEDPRLAHRPKAIRVKDVVTALPATLDDLLDDQPASYTTAQLSRNSASADHQRGRKRGAEAAHGIAKRGQDTRDPEQADDDEDNEAFEVVVSKDGKITVQARDTETVTGHKQGDKMSNGKGSALRGKVRTRPTDDDEEDTSRNLHKADAVGGKRQRVRAPGEEYRSKKSGGDIWRRGMLQPHAYIPLDPRLLSKKNHKEAVEKFGAVVNAPKGSGSKKQVAHNKRKQVVVGNRNQRRNMRDK